MYTTNKHLTIVVPYRDRYEHFCRFVPHIKNCFDRDSINRLISYNLIFVEQEYGMPFNRGALKNIGFMIAMKKNSADYVCFHDIDYLPIWVDYSYPDLPTSLAWFGAETRLVDPGHSDTVVYHNLETFFGGAVLFPIHHFLSVNGYSNDYWGWGYEDGDIQKRLQYKGIQENKRKGTFEGLLHKNEGFNHLGQSTSIADVNARLYKSRWSKISEESMADGLTSLDFDILLHNELYSGDQIGRGKVEVFTVRINNAISLDHNLHS